MKSRSMCKKLYFRNDQTPNGNNDDLRLTMV